MVKNRPARGGPKVVAEDCYRLAGREQVVAPFDDFSAFDDEYAGDVVGVFLAVFVVEVIDAVVDDDGAHRDGAEHFEAGAVESLEECGKSGYHFILAFDDRGSVDHSERNVVIEVTADFFDVHGFPCRTEIVDDFFVGRFRGG